MATIMQLMKEVTPIKAVRQVDCVYWTVPAMLMKRLPRSTTKKQRSALTSVWTTMMAMTRAVYIFLLSWIRGSFTTTPKTQSEKRRML